MSQWWAVPMLLSGGLFVGGLVSIAWERVPAWRATDLPDFRTGFAHTLRRVDRLQPALLVVCLGSTIGFASGVGGRLGAGGGIQERSGCRLACSRSSVRRASALELYHGSRRAEAVAASDPAGTSGADWTRQRW